MTPSTQQQSIETLLAGTVTVAEAARLTGLSTRTIIRYLDSGRLTRLRLGPRAVRVVRAELDALVTEVTR